MKRIRRIAMLCAVLTVLACLAGCSAELRALQGTWGYIHDPETPVLCVRPGGKAEYHNVWYTCRADGSFLTLVSSGGAETRLRYTLDDDGMLLYETASYEREGAADAADPLLGKWVNEASNWSFEFTADGTFMEDGYFPGYYINNGDGTVKLIYNDQFEDAVLYYTVDDDTLTVEYPWRMVRDR